MSDLSKFLEPEHLCDTYADACDTCYNEYRAWCLREKAIAEFVDKWLAEHG